MTSLGHGYTAEECKQACADTTEFTCVAAMMESVGRCFISGYSLISDYFSTHYARTCAEGKVSIQCLAEVGLSKVNAVYIRFINTPSLHTFEVDN